MHVIVLHDKRAIEIQVRTSLQHLWAEMSEKLSDLIDAKIKYGGGDPDIQSVLEKSSAVGAGHEELTRQAKEIRNLVASGAQLPEDILKKLAEAESALATQGEEISELFSNMAQTLGNAETDPDDLPN